jgi:hypothetical protein
MIGDEDEKPGSKPSRDTDNQQDDSKKPDKEPVSYEEQYGTREIDRSKIVQK